MSCATDDCGVPSCRVCVWSRSSPPDADALRWRWLADADYTREEIAVIQAATMKARERRQREAAKKKEKR